MIQTLFVVTSTSILFTGCGGGGSTTTTTTTTTQCRELQPIIQKLNRQYSSSKDDYISYNATRTAYKGSRGSGGSGGSHNEGRNCLSCHRFASAATVFSSLNAGNNTPGVAGYRIKLSTGTVYSASRGTGNSRAFSFPSGKFTAQVIDANGNVVNSSAEMSHDGSRRACNSCHTASGNSGAPGRITSRRLSAGTTNCTTPSGNGTVSVSFNSIVFPLLSAKCKSCHGSNGRFKVTTSKATYANISALKGSASAGAKYLLDKSSNTIGHGGGKVIAAGSAEYTTLKAWVDSSAPNN